MTKVWHAGHIDRAYHSPNQQRMFFALSSSLGHDPDEAKERAKAHFGVKCFNALTKKNMIYLIDRLAMQQETRNMRKEEEEQRQYNNERATKPTQGMTGEEREKEAKEANAELLKNL